MKQTFIHWLHDAPQTALQYHAFQQIQHIDALPPYFETVIAMTNTAERMYALNQMVDFIHNSIENASTTERQEQQHVWTIIQDMLTSLKQLDPKPVSVIRKMEIYSHNRQYHEIKPVQITLTDKQLAKWSHTEYHKQCEVTQFESYTPDTQQRIIEHWLRKNKNEIPSNFANTVHPSVTGLFYRYQLYHHPHSMNLQNVTGHIFNITNHDDTPYAPFNANTYDAFVVELLEHAEAHGDLLDIGYVLNQINNYQNYHRKHQVNLHNNPTVTRFYQHIYECIHNYLHANRLNDTPYVTEPTTMASIIAQGDTALANYIVQNNEQKKHINACIHAYKASNEKLPQYIDKRMDKIDTNFIHTMCVHILVTHWYKTRHETDTYQQFMDACNHEPNAFEQFIKNHNPLLENDYIIANIAETMWFKQAPNTCNKTIHECLVNSKQLLYTWTHADIGRFLEECVSKDVTITYLNNPHIANGLPRLLLTNLNHPHCTAMILETLFAKHGYTHDAWDKHTTISEQYQRWMNVDKSIRKNIERELEIELRESNMQLIQSYTNLYDHMNGYM